MTTFVDTSTGRVSDHHSAELDASEISSEVREARGYETLYGTDEDRARLREADIPAWAWREDTAFPGLFIPLYRVTGECIGAQFKPGQPQPCGEKTMKYASAKGKAGRLDVPPTVSTGVRVVTTPLWITEGVKKADSLASKGLAAIGISGVWNWRRSGGTLGDWEDIPLKGRTVVICFDSDTKHKRQVSGAMRRLGMWLESKGVTDIRYLIVPEEVDGTPVKGVDDYFHAGGTLDGLRDAATKEMPSDNTRDAAFSDAMLADTVCFEALDGNYRWASGLGWMRWDGKVWTECTDATVMEEIRQWALAGFQRVLDKQRAEPSKDYRNEMDGWRGALAASKLGNLLKLSRGVLESSATEFDSDPDVINCRNGILDLRTGVLTPHDPDRLMTKITGCDYVPATFHPDWKQALEAVPEAVREWFQIRMGQAITGHTPPDDIILICQGGGSNGKSTVMDAIAKAAGKRGGYHTAVADRALLGNASDNHPTEMMDFLGARLAVLEETPETKRLDVTRVKKLAGTDQITARKMRQDSVTFAATHSLVINTNPKPLVEESDHGTWRRLAMLCFPYTYRKPGEACTGPNDRPGDLNLRQRVKTDERVAEAVLAWLVDGARKWYAADRIMPPVPEDVEKDTLEWRRESDLVLSFIGDCLRFDFSSHVLARELHEVFNKYLADKGHREWTDRTFVARFGGHDECSRNSVERKKIRARDGLSSLERNPKIGVNYVAWLGVAFQDPDGKDDVNGGVPDPVPAVPGSGYDEKIGSRIGGYDDAGTTGTRSWNAPDADPFGSDPFAETETDHVPATAIVPAPATPPAQESVPPRAGAAGFDLETRSVDELFTHTDIGGDPYVRLSGYIDEGGTEIVANSPAELIKRLEDADEIYGHNIFRFDLMALARHCGADYDKLAAKAVDTYVWATVADPPGARGKVRGYYGLDQVAARLGIPGKADDLKALALKHAPEEIDGRTLTKDERVAYGLARIPADDPEYRAYFSGDLKATRGVRRALGEPTPYVRREMRVAHLQNRMTLNGWRVDVPLLNTLVREEEERKQASLTWLHENCGVPLTRSVTRGRGKDKVTVDEAMKSPLATKEGKAAIIAAFADRGATNYPKTPSGEIALNKDAMGRGRFLVGKGRGARQVPGMLSTEVLDWIAGNGGDAEAVREMCEHIVTVTTTVAKYQEIANHLVGNRVYGHIGEDQASGRWAMVKPSLTNLGKRGGKVTQRAPFLPEPGHVLLAFDLDQVDMRAIAGHCQDPEYMKLFAPGMDAHSMVADAVFGRHDGEWRDYAKRIGHGYNYGMGIEGIVNSGVDLALAEQFFRRMEESYPTLCAWREEVRARGRAGELLDNGFGRLMRCDPDRAYTQAPALMGQGGARDIMCEALLRLVDRLPECLPWLRGVVHDEVVMSVPEHMWKGVEETVLEAFTFEFKGVPITAGSSEPGANWALCYGAK